MAVVVKHLHEPTILKIDNAFQVSAFAQRQFLHIFCTSSAGFVEVFMHDLCTAKLCTICSLSRQAREDPATVACKSAQMSSIAALVKSQP